MLGEMIFDAIFDAIGYLIKRSRTPKEARSSVFSDLNNKFNGEKMKVDEYVLRFEGKDDWELREVMGDDFRSSYEKMAACQILKERQSYDV